MFERIKNFFSNKKVSREKILDRRERMLKDLINMNDAKSHVLDVKLRMINEKETSADLVIQNAVENKIKALREENALLKIRNGILEDTSARAILENSELKGTINSMVSLYANQTAGLWNFKKVDDK